MLLGFCESLLGAYSCLKTEHFQTGLKYIKRRPEQGGLIEAQTQLHFARSHSACSTLDLQLYDDHQTSDYKKVGSYQLISLVIMEQQRLFEGPSNISIRGGALKIGGCKFGKFVLG